MDISKTYGKLEMMLNLHKLNIFATIAEAGSFTAAAEQLYLTQSAVSQHVRDLEAQLGTELFVRGRSGATLTPAGETLLGYVERVLWLLAEAESAVTDVTHLSEGQLHLGATSTAAVYLLPQWVRNFRRDYPSLRVSLQTESADAIVQALLADQIDLGFVEGAWPETQRLHHLPLQDSELRVVVGEDHPWRSRDRLSVRELDKQLFITYSPRNPARTWTDEIFGRYDVSPLIVAEFDDPEAIKRAVMEGMEASILPCCAVRRESDEGRIHLLSIEEQPLRRPIELLWRADRPLKATARAFLSSLVGQYPSLLDEVEAQ
ncbi:LysR family transcriptional regulator [bacterium]|nr:LysR family transcriptional regulator [bacterium]